MKTLFGRILLWFGGTLVFSLVAFIATSTYLNSQTPTRGHFMSRISSMQLDDARKAYETGGKEGLRVYMDHLHQFLMGQRYVLDAKGRDLLTGEDRSAELQLAAQGPPRFPWPIGELRWPTSEKLRIRRPSADGKYILLAIVDPPTSIVEQLPIYGWIVVALVLMCYGLAVSFAAPLRQLREIVARFGNGDLASRAKSSRKDELGDLAGAFDQMADRIQTLLTAERRLLQDISHELRSPLARLGFAVELARTSQNREASLDRIKREVSRLSNLVGELLQVTRAEGDPASRNLQPVDLEELLLSVVDDCAIEADMRGCRIVLRGGPPEPLQGDPELLRRAIENILRNAIRHAPEGTQIEVQMERAAEGVSLAVRDCGPGVPEEMLGDIFKPFFRVESDRNRAQGGVGLGLAIAQRAVSLHHGQLTASNCHPGLEVRMQLPVKAA